MSLKRPPTFLQAVQACQSGPQMGASHAIGHILGPAFDVPHGYTSCVALPAVLRWNAEDVGAGWRHRAGSSWGVSGIVDLLEEEERIPKQMGDIFHHVIRYVQTNNDIFRIPFSGPRSQLVYNNLPFFVGWFDSKIRNDATFSYPLCF